MIDRSIVESYVKQTKKKQTKKNDLFISFHFILLEKKEKQLTQTTISLPCFFFLFYLHSILTKNDQDEQQQQKNRDHNHN